MPTSWNVFLTGREPNDEDQLTEMLFWLISVAPAVGWSVLELAFGKSGSTGSELEAETQKPVPGGYLDGLITTDGFQLAIESKLGSGYETGQLAKYLRWLASSKSSTSETRRGLMTVTKHRGDWPEADRTLADNLSVEPFSVRWADLHAKLADLVGSMGADEAERRLLSEFLEMLTMEGLVPMVALSDSELGSSWLEAYATIRRMHDFLRSCRDEIADSLHAEATASSAATVEWTYQEFKLESGARIWVGLEYSDRSYSKPRTETGELVLWVQVGDVEQPGWEESARWLVDHPPTGWNTRLVSNSRSRMWQRARSVLAGKSIEEQRQAVASGAHEGRLWLESLPAPTAAPRANGPP
jgi:hypothetical protein